MKKMAQESNLTGLNKAAILMISLGPERAAAVLKFLHEDKIKMISSEIADTVVLSKNTKNIVLEEFLDLSNDEFLSNGGIEYARELLEKMVGKERASGIMRTFSSRLKAFGFINKTDPREIVKFIKDEHPQTIALILSYIDPDKAAGILNALPQETQSDIVWRIATMEKTSPEIIKEVEAVLEKSFSSIVSHDFTSVGGLTEVVKILNMVDRGTEKSILTDMEKEDPDLAEEIRKRLFLFEDIAFLDDKSIRRVLREVDFKDLAIALKGSNDEVAEVIFKNISKRAAERLKEDIEVLGPIRLREVEEKQQGIVQIIRRLDEAGEIIVSRGGQNAVII